MVTIIFIGGMICDMRVANAESLVISHIYTTTLGGTALNRKVTIRVPFAIINSRMQREARYFNFSAALSQVVIKPRMSDLPDKWVFFLD